MAELRDGCVDLARDLPDGAGKRLAAPAHARAQAEGAGGADRDRGLARARGQGARRPAWPRAEGRSGRRYRGTGADLSRATVVLAVIAQGVRALKMGTGNSGSRQTRA